MIKDMEKVKEFGLARLGSDLRVINNKKLII